MKDPSYLAEISANEQDVYLYLSFFISFGYVIRKAFKCFKKWRESRQIHEKRD